MKNFFKKHGLTKCIGGLVNLIGIVLLIVSAFLKNNSTVMVLHVIGFLLFLIGGFIYFLQAKNHRLFKLLAFLAFVAFLMTWVFPYGYFQGVDFYDYGMKRIGLNDLGIAVYQSLYFTIDKVLYLLLLAGFYGILSHIDAYKSLVNGIAKKCKKQPILTAILMSLFIVLLTSFLNQSFVVLAFIPFLMAILLNMDIDKLTTFAITFGSMLIGILGATYGTDSLFFFNQYLNLDVNTGILYRVIILVVAFFLYNFFLAFRLKKVLKENKKSNKKEDIKDVAFAIDSDSKKSKKWPLVVLISIFFVLIVLGFVNWQSFGVKAFTNFHDWLSKISIGKNFNIFAYILGSKFRPFGEFDLISMMVLLIIFGLIISLAYKVKLSDVIINAVDGVKKMIMPILGVLGAYFVFSICALSPFMPAVTNWALNLVKGLNPYIASLVAFITSIFHVDLGYTAYSVGSFLTAAYAENIGIVHTIFYSMFGLVQVFMPTSVILLIGLNLMNIDYKNWLKYIWLFVLGMLIILLVLFTVLVYV